MEWIEVKIKVLAPIDLVWECWNDPKHVIHWNFASKDWCCPNATNDLQVGGKFTYRMEAKDKSMGFDFEGKYTELEHEKLISYELEDGRRVQITFSITEEGILIKEAFETEDVNSAEMQRDGWQAILGNFKTYVEKIN